MKIGILGSGNVAQTLALGFLKHGHSVQVGSRDPSKLKAWKDKDAPAATLGSFKETAAAAEVIVLAVKGTAAASALEMAGAEALAGKVVIDTTNPIADAPPTNGIITYFTGPNDSLMERLQKQFPGAHFVKAFNSVGAALMVNPALDGRPSMFIGGNDAAAKKVVTDILTSFGWATEDVGGVEAARAIEPLCQLWCAPGFLRGDWRHAFKMIR
ncbi:MAG: NAD(P)-binding domain-containing protein [Myxococcota bacterium]